MNDHKIIVAKFRRVRLSLIAVACGLAAVSVTNIRLGNSILTALQIVLFVLIVLILGIYLKLRASLKKTTQIERKNRLLTNR